MKVLFLLALLLLVIVVPAGAHECACDFDSGQEFGQHVADHAQTGHLGADMNPGHHRGFSPWARE